MVAALVFFCYLDLGDVSPRRHCCKQVVLVQCSFALSSFLFAKSLASLLVLFFLFLLFLFSPFLSSSSLSRTPLSPLLSRPFCLPACTAVLLLAFTSYTRALPSLRLVSSYPTTTTAAPSSTLPAHQAAVYPLTLIDID